MSQRRELGLVEVLADPPHDELHRPPRLRGQAGRQDLGRQGGAQVEAGHEQHPGAVGGGPGAGQVEQDEVVLAGQGAQDGPQAGGGVGPAAPLPGQDRDAEPGRQGVGEALGAEDGLRGVQVVPAQTGSVISISRVIPTRP